MDNIFVDTAAWIALLDRSDSLHQKADQIFNKLSDDNARLVTTEFILLELGDGFSAAGKRREAFKFIEDLRKSEILRIIPATQELVNEGWSLYAERSDKHWQVTDCISFIVMKKEGIYTAFTSDKHFEQAGFAKLM